MNPVFMLGLGIKVQGYFRTTSRNVLTDAALTNLLIGLRNLKNSRPDLLKSRSFECIESPGIRTKQLR